MAGGKHPPWRRNKCFVTFAKNKVPCKTAILLTVTAVMKRTFLIPILLFPVYVNAQTMCGTTDEGGSITLTAPPGNAFTSIVFASYGTPNGSCGSFTIGGCHAGNSVSICSAILVGNNSGTVNANNGVFGDPCGGTFKRLYIEASYSAVVPLTLISFTAKRIGDGKVQLDWVSDNESNTSHFVIEKSADGLIFEPSGTVAAVGYGASSYHFTDKMVTGSVNSYFRLKTVDRDGSFQYSKVLPVKNDAALTILSVVPNLATGYITIISSKQQDALVMNNTGMLIKRINLINGTQFLNIASWPDGIYFIKTGEAAVRFVKQWD